MAKLIKTARRTAGLWATGLMVLATGCVSAPVPRTDGVVLLEGVVLGMSDGPDFPDAPGEVRLGGLFDVRLSVRRTWIGAAPTRPVVVRIPMSGRLIDDGRGKRLYVLARPSAEGVLVGADWGWSRDGLCVSANAAERLGVAEEVARLRSSRCV